MTQEKSPKIFISYSHDSHEHKNWVLILANKLRADGVDVILDQWDLELGQNLPLFMEQGITKADRIIIICTDLYIKKANLGKGGVGYEKNIATAELMKDFDTKKVIPIIRSVTGEDKTPIFLAGRVYEDFSNESEFDDHYKILIGAIHKVPNSEKCDLGANPFSKHKASVTLTEKVIDELQTLEEEINGQINFTKLEEGTNSNKTSLLASDPAFLKDHFLSRGSSNFTAYLIYFDHLTIPYFGNLQEREAQSGDSFSGFYRCGNIGVDIELAMLMDGIEGTQHIYRDLVEANSPRGAGIHREMFKKDWREELKYFEFLDINQLFTSNDQLTFKDQMKNITRPLAELLNSAKFPTSGCFSREDLESTTSEEDVIQEMYGHIFDAIQQYIIQVIANRSSKPLFSHKISPIYHFIESRIKKRKKKDINFYALQLLDETVLKLPYLENITLNDMTYIRDRFTDTLIPARRSIKRLLFDAYSYKNDANEEEILEYLKNFIKMRLQPDLDEFKDSVARSNINRNEIDYNRMGESNLSFNLGLMNRPVNMSAYYKNLLHSTPYKTGNNDYLALIYTLSEIENMF